VRLWSVTLHALRVAGLAEAATWSPSAVRAAVGSVREGVAGAVERDFEDFVAAHGAALVRLARGLLKDPHHAEDVVQDVLAKALVRWSSVQRADVPEAYVRRMVVNACTSFWRRAVRREHAREHADLPERAAPDDPALLADRDQALGLLRRLPPRQRAVLVLRHYEGIPDAEIADLLGCSAVTVRSNAHRGLASLRGMLAGTSGPAPAPGGRRG
jgi:RNA polymerase sigma-70 factor (sigma-E family)